jgi:hypothetical protein
MTISRFGSRSTAVHKTHRQESGSFLYPLGCTFPILSFPFHCVRHSHDPQFEPASCFQPTTRITTHGCSQSIFQLSSSHLCPSCPSYVQRVPFAHCHHAKLTASALNRHIGSAYVYSRATPLALRRRRATCLAQALRQITSVRPPSST